MIDDRQQEPPSYEEAHAKRMYDLIHTIPYDIYIGTLWWVDEDIWKENLGSFYDQSSTRQAHPGLSIRSAPLATPYEMTQMLHGTSGRRGPVRVRNLSADENRLTSFGRMRPVGMALHHFPSRIRQNTHKPVIDSDEMNDLKDWLKKKGLLDEQ